MTTLGFEESGGLTIGLDVLTYLRATRVWSLSGPSVFLVRRGNPMKQGPTD